MKRKNKILVAAIAAIVLLPIVGYLAGYLFSYRLPAELAAEAVVCTPDGEVPLGGTLTAVTELTLPLHCPPPETAIVPPEGMVTAGRPEVTAAGYRWNRTVWRITAHFRPFRAGAAAGGKLELTLPKSDRRQTLEVPAAVIAPAVSDHPELDLAGALSPVPANRSYGYYVGAALLLLLLAAAIIFARQRQRTVPARRLAAWERAELDLETLRGDVRQKRINLALAFVRLTDLVRNYLEERYQLPASVRTTDEFMEDLKSDKTPLPPEEKPFLAEFLTAADLVKFARMPPEEASLLRAVDGAEQLVRHTTPVAGENHGSGEAGEEARHV